MRLYAIFIILFLGLVYAESFDAIPECPTVFDGLTNGLFDMSTQFATQNTISSNWVGLSSSDVIGYEWAIISDKKAAKLSSGCRLSQGFNGIPDIQDWTSVHKQTSVTSNRLNLVPETTYYIVLRTTLQNGAHVYSNSNGIVVLPSEMEEKFTPKEDSKTLTTRNTNSRETRITQKDPRTNVIVNGESCFIYGETCDIDNENRCRQSKVTVHDYLNTIYGKAKFPVITPLPPILVKEETRTYNDDDDDNSGAINNGIVIATVVGGVLFFLIPLLILCCIACVLNNNNDDDKFTDRIQEKDVEQVDADGGTFKQHSIGAENTKVEFPDIDPHNRLSVA